MKILIAALFLVSSLAAKCTIKMDEYDIGLYDYLKEFYACGELGRSFVLDVSVDRQLPIRAFYSYDRKDYLDVLRNILGPLGLQVQQGRYSDAIIPADTRAYNPSAVGAVATSSIVPTFAPSIVSDSSRDSVYMVLGGRLVSGLDSSRLLIVDSLQRANDYPIDLSLSITLLSADTLRKYGISEPEYIAQVRSSLKLGGTYAFGVMAYNDTMADYQTLNVRLYDSLKLAVGPRKRITQSTYSDGKVIESKTENEQFGLQCDLRRSADTVRYVCSYSRTNDGADYVAFQNSMRVGENQAISYNLSQTLTSRQGGIFWLIPLLSRNVQQKKRYVLAIAISTQKTVKDGHAPAPPRGG